MQMSRSLRRSVTTAGDRPSLPAFCLRRRAWPGARMARRLGYWIYDAVHYAKARAGRGGAGVEKHERRLLITLMIAVAVLVLNGLWAGTALRTLVEDVGWYSHTNEVIAQVEGVRATIAEATAAVRAYLLTGDDAY